MGKVGEVHGKFFSGIRPATTMVGVWRFISPEILVEIEADALIGQDDATRAAARDT